MTFSRCVKTNSVAADNAIAFVLCGFCVWRWIGWTRCVRLVNGTCWWWWWTNDARARACAARLYRRRDYSHSLSCWIYYTYMAAGVDVGKRTTTGAAIRSFLARRCWRVVPLLAAYGICVPRWRGPLPTSLSLPVPIALPSSINFYLFTLLLHAFS